ncbi:MAG: NeuD/PglB/VioB family sugar acetyltransferase [Planctomycetes bacterium]|nr:NeuD/PglB/VioB family sugar acetyltransferase [Planctomycetota bacterium]
MTAETRRLFLIGAGGLGREIAAWVEGANPAGKDWDVFAGFLDANPDALAKVGRRNPVLGSEADFEFRTGDCVVVTLGDPAVRERVAASLEGRVRFATLVHETAIIGPGCQIGEGSILAPGVVLTADATLGRHVLVNIGCCVAHDTVLDDYATLCPRVDVTGGASVGRGAFVGTHATILPRVAVGAAAKVGAGSVVLRRVPEGTTVFGNPARPA